MTRLAHWTIANALEHQMPDSESALSDIAYVHFRDRPELWIAAATSWISVAGRYILKAALDDRTMTRAAAGPLWLAVGGDELFDNKRWSFWKQRLAQLAGHSLLGLEVSGALASAVREMDIRV